MDATKLNGTYDHFGYMLTYRGHNIGGAGVAKKPGQRRLPSNLKFHREQLGVEIAAIKRGYKSTRYAKIIDSLDEQAIIEFIPTIEGGK